MLNLHQPRWAMIRVNRGSNIRDLEKGKNRVGHTLEVFDFFFVILLTRRQYRYRGWNMCQSPIAVLTNNHKPHGLKQHKFTILLSWRSEVLKRQGCIPSEALENSIVFSTFQRLSTFPASRPCITLTLLPSHLLWLWPSCLPFIRSLVTALRQLW